MKLRLEAKTKEQEFIKAYLEENVSDILADKINNGARIVKDGAVLLNKKTLDGFMTYAADEARKLAEKGAHSICVEDKVVYGWAVHYFEEDGIEGTLYNPDGTKYRPKPKAADKPKPGHPAVKSKPEPQLPLFELMDKTNDTTAAEERTNEPANSIGKNTATDDTSNDYALSEEDDDVISEEERREILTEAAAEEELERSKEYSSSTGTPFYRNYLKLQEQYPDCIVAYRVGDFYEVFGERAELLSETLGLMLTSRDCGLNERVPMVGFPYHAADNYISKAIKRGLKIAVAEGLNDEVRILSDSPAAPHENSAGSVPSPVRHWLDSDTYADEDGVVHTVDGSGQDVGLADDGFDVSAFDLSLLGRIEDIFGKIFIPR